MVAGARQARVDSIAGPLLRQCQGKQIQIRILDNDAVTAYGWRGGNVFLTRGLVDLMRDDELAAAIAHELGHLLGDGYVRSVTSLHGCDQEQNLDTEHRADVIGAELLRNGNLPPSAMTRMLQKVQGQRELTAACRRAVAKRVELLEDRFPTEW
jgi:Zn-dependent protease with chaperone function